LSRYSPLSSLDGRSPSPSRVGGSDHYDPNQPRVPAGHSDGGQWTRLGSLGGGSGRSTRSAVRYASAAHSVDRPAATLSDATRVARSSDFNTLVVAPSGRAPTPAITLQHILRWYAGAADRNAPGRWAILEFRAVEFRPDGSIDVELERATQLDRDEVNKKCKKLGVVQRLTDKAFGKIKQEFQESGKPVWGPVFGTAVHDYVANAIGEHDKNFRAEMTVWNDITDKPIPKGEKPKPGDKLTAVPGSVRLDVFERRDNDTACIYDIKTGRQRLTYARMHYLMEKVRDAFEDVKRFIFIEVRPSEWRNR